MVIIYLNLSLTCKLRPNAFFFLIYSDQNDIAFVKIDDDNEASEWGIEELPTMVLFERGIPHIYEGDLMQEEELLGWLIHQKKHTEIPEVTDEMKDKLIETFPHVAVIFCEYN